MGKASYPCCFLSLSFLRMAELTESFEISQLFCLLGVVGVVLGPQEVNRVEDVAQWNL